MIPDHIFKCKFDLEPSKMALVAQSPTLCGSKLLISPKWKNLGLQAALENASMVDHNKILSEPGGP